MKNVLIIAVVGIFAMSQAQAASAFLVRQYIGKSVTGLGVQVCVYQYAGQQFEKLQAMGTMCASSIEVQ